jgi:hypothetical protein
MHPSSNTVSARASEMCEFLWAPVLRLCPYEVLDSYFAICNLYTMSITNDDVLNSQYSILLFLCEMSVRT